MKVVNRKSKIVCAHESLYGYSYTPDVDSYMFSSLSSQAAPRLSEDKVKQCVDARMNGEYPPKSVAKVMVR